MDNQEIVSRFDYYPPRSRQRVEAHQEVRDHLGGLAQHFAGLLPDGREKSLAITKLEEAMFWANAALARAFDHDAVVSPEEAAAGPLTPLRVGDRVRSEPDEVFTADHPRGHVGEVVKVYEGSRWPYAVAFDGAEGTYNYSRHDLTLLPEEEEEQAVAGPHPGQGEPFLDRDDEEGRAEPDKYLGRIDPREALDPDEQVPPDLAQEREMTRESEEVLSEIGEEDQVHPRCSYIVSDDPWDGTECGEPAVGYVAEKMAYRLRCSFHLLRSRDPAPITLGGREFTIQEIKEIQHWVSKYFP